MIDSDLEPQESILDLLSRAIALTIAADGPNSEKVSWHYRFREDETQRNSAFVRHKVAEGHSFSPLELRSGAVELLQEAAKVMPDEPWIWFQVGWNLFAYEDGPCELQAAKSALQQVLEQKPDHRLAHLALAWLCWRELEGTAQLGEDANAALWEGDVGDHLRATLDRERGTAALEGELGRIIESDLHARITFPGIDGFDELDYFPTLGGNRTVTAALSAMEDIVPPEYRFRFCLLYARLVEDFDLAGHWYEEALRWPSDDNPARFFAHYCVGKSSRGVRPAHCYKHWLAALNYFELLSEDDRFAVSDFFYFLLDGCVLLARDVHSDDIALFMQVVDALLDLRKVRHWGLSTLLNLGQLSSTAARLLLETGDILRAKPYLTSARTLENKVIKDEEYNRDDWEASELDDPRFWRITTARGLRDAYLDEDRLEKAWEENERVLQFRPNDTEARKLRPLLKEARQSREDRQTFLHRLDDIRRTAIVILDRVTIQSTALDRLAAISEDLQITLRERSLGSGEVNDLIDRLHQLVEQGYQISPAIWQRTHQRLFDDLGGDFYEALFPDSQHYLQTAEAIFSASERLAGQADAALIAVEYSKVVETELRRRFLPALAAALERMNYKHELSVGNRGIRYRGVGTWNRELPALSLGGAIALLDKALTENENQKIREFMERIEPHPGWARRLVDDLKTVAHRYRNGAAHIERMDRQTLNEFRTLLFDGGLLRRIVQLGQLAEKP